MKNNTRIKPTPVKLQYLFIFFLLAVKKVVVVLLRDDFRQSLGLCNLTTRTERRPQTNWAGGLKIESIAIGLDDSFFKVGGNSITAMKLMGDARNVGVDLAVADIFRLEAPVALTL